MIVTVTGPVEKQCPYKDEKDYGTVTLTFDVTEGDGPELHWLSDYLRTFAGVAVSHEEFTRTVAADFQPIHARSTWQTAGLEVSVDVPDRRQ